MAQAKLSVKRQQRQRTRRRLVDAALTLFASKSYQATSVDDICKRAALSKGAFYFHFPGKEALLVEALERLRAEGSGDSDPGSGGSAGDSRGASGFRDGGRQSNAGMSAALQLEVWAQALRQDQVWRHLHRSRTRAMAELLHRLRRRGTEGSGDAEARARAVVALADGLILQSLLFPDDAKRARLDAIVATLARQAAGAEPLRPSLGAAPEKRSA